MEDKICGIYMIKNKVSNESYIGQAVDIYSRWKRHINELHNQCHYNKHLQRSWNKYGENSFEFSIVEVCSETELNAKEIYWIAENNSFYNGYNQTKGGDGVRGYKHSDEYKQKVSERVSGEKNYFYNVRFCGDKNGFYGDHRFSGKNHPRCRAIYCYELDELFWGAKEAQDKYGVYKADIAKCCKGKLKSAGKHPVTGEKLHWVYTDEIDNSSVA